jgi:alpha-mannosidase
VTGIYKDGAKFDEKNSLDGGGYSYSSDLLGSDQIGDGVDFKFGSAGAPDAVTSATVDLPSGKFSSIKLLAVGVEGSQESQIFTVNYADGSSSPFTQSLSDWAYPGKVSGESSAVDMPYRLESDGNTDSRHFYIYAYSFNLDKTKNIRSISLPNNRNVVVFAITLVPAK